MNWLEDWLAHPDAKKYDHFDSGRRMASVNLRVDIDAEIMRTARRSGKEKP